MAKSNLNVKHIFFICSLLVGIGLCVGGIWLPPLLIPGGAFIAGALGMMAQAYFKGRNQGDSDHAPDIQMQPVHATPERPRQTKTLKYSRHISSHGLHGEHYREDVEGEIQVTKDKTPTSSDEYETAEGSGNSNSRNRLTLV